MSGDSPAREPAEPFHARTAAEVLEALEVRPERGLSRDAVRRRRKTHGPNRLRRARRRSAWRILAGQWTSVVVLLLAGSSILAFLFARWVEGVAIATVIVINGLLGFFSEWRAVRSMEALREAGKPRARVRRRGRERTIAAEDLVPGDVVLHESGDIVPADLRLVEANAVRVDESVLTGESVATGKTADPVDPDRPLAERDSMLFKGTTIVQGSAAGVVVTTGMNTELGEIAALTEEVQLEGAGATPLERRLEQLGRRLAWVVVGTAAVIAAAGLLAGRPPLGMIEVSIALGVAAIPEGLPIVATLSLARGMWLMAQRHVVVNRLASVETLGATQWIFSDKTGTLTENRMTVKRVDTPAGARDLTPEEEPEPDGEAPPEALLRRVLEVGVLCNNASLAADGNEEDQGDPMEVALLRAGAAVEIARGDLLEEKPETREVAFDSSTKMMATFHRDGDGFEVAVKGAPGAVLEQCVSIVNREGDGEQRLESADRERWIERAETLGGEGLRVLAVADQRVGSDAVEPYESLRFLGLVGLLDPPARGVSESIARCREAGIHVAMVTGDLPETARSISRGIGIVEDDRPAVLLGEALSEPDRITEEDRERVLETRVFARFSPKQKLHLVEIFQAGGRIVAMTGDGVNDTPALRKADIGVAMGRRGTDAARQAADMVLKDDAFPSIVSAVEQGRVIFENIRRSVVFMLCTNLAEIVVVAASSLTTLPLPILPLQILYLNILTDAWPALALGVGKGRKAVMERPPRHPEEAILTRSHWLSMGSWSAVIAACVLAALLISLDGLGMDRVAAVTVSFLTLAFAKLFFVFNLRAPGSKLLQNDITRNPWLWAALGLCLGFLLMAVYLPVLAGVLDTRPPGPRGWAVVLGLSILPFLTGQLIRSRQRPERLQEAENRETE
jgi:Ca2+-transporting ATPase